MYNRLAPPQPSSPNLTLFEYSPSYSPAKQAPSSNTPYTFSDSAKRAFIDEMLSKSARKATPEPSSIDLTVNVEGGKRKRRSFRRKHRKTTRKHRRPRGKRYCTCRCY